jgi:hypothetical protein
MHSGDIIEVVRFAEGAEEVTAFWCKHNSLGGQATWPGDWQACGLSLPSAFHDDSDRYFCQRTKEKNRP